MGYREEASGQQTMPLTDSFEHKCNRNFQQKTKTELLKLVLVLNKSGHSETIELTTKRTFS